MNSIDFALLCNSSFFKKKKSNSNCNNGSFECAEPYICGFRECEKGRTQKVLGLMDNNYRTEVKFNNEPAAFDISDLYSEAGLLFLLFDLYANTPKRERLPSIP